MPKKKVVQKKKVEITKKQIPQFVLPKYTMPTNATDIIGRTPVQTIKDNQKGQEIVNRNIATDKRTFVGTAPFQTIDDKRKTKEKKKQLVQNNPNIELNDNDDIVLTNPDRGFEGQPLTPNAKRIDKGLEHMMNALEITSALAGAGQISSNLVRLGASQLEKKIGRNLISKNLKNFTSKINPTLNAIDEVGAYVQMDPIGIIGNKLNSKFYDPTTALNISNNTVTGVEKNLTNSAVEASDLILGENITGEPVITGASQNDIDYGLSMKDWFEKTGSSSHEDYFNYLKQNKFQTTPSGIFHIGDVRENVATNPDFSGGVGAFQIHPDLFKKYIPQDYKVGDFNTGTEAVFNFYNKNKDQSVGDMYKKYSGDRKGEYTPVFNRTYNRMKKTYKDGGYVGEDGYTDQGFNYNSAWGGQFAMGGSLPGSVGFTYARTNSPAPSNGKYAKKTMASADDGIKKKKGKTKTDDVTGPISFLNSYTASPEFKKRFKGTAKEYQMSQDILNYQSQNYKPYTLKSDPNGIGSRATDYMMNKQFGIPEDTTVVLSEPQAKSLNADLINDILPHEWAHKIRNLGIADQAKFAYANNNPNSEILFNEWIADKNKKGEEATDFSKWLANNVEGGVHDERPSENYSDLDALRWTMYKQGIYDTRKGPMNKEQLQKAMKDPFIKKQFGTKRLLERFSPEEIMMLNNTVAQNDVEEELTPIAQNGHEMSYYQNGLDWKPKSISKDGSKIATTSTETTSPGFTLPKLDLPTSADSSFLRQKFLEQQQFFKNNPSYKKVSTVPTKKYVKDKKVTSMNQLLTDSATNIPINRNVSINKINSDISEIKKQLNNSELSQNEKLILQESLKALTTTKNKVSSEISGYKKDIDENRYQQREFTLEIINPNVPMGTYDKRIDPQNVTTYEGLYQGNVDVVEMPEYDPIALKPRIELSEKELKYRLKKYNTKEDREFYNAKFVTPKNNTILEKPVVTQAKKIETTKTSTVPTIKNLEMKKSVDVPNLQQKSNYVFTWSADGNKQNTTYFPTYDLWKEAVNKANAGKPGYNAGMVETTESGDKSSGQALLRGTPQFKRGGWLDDL